MSLINLHNLPDDNYFAVGRFFIRLGYIASILVSSRRSMTCKFENFPEPISQSACSYPASSTNIKIVVGFESTNLKIYDVNLNPIRSMKASHPFVSIHIIADLVITSSLDEICVWSKKKDEIVASKNCNISFPKAILINKKEILSDDWADEMAKDETISYSENIDTKFQ